MGGLSFGLLGIGLIVYYFSYMGRFVVSGGSAVDSGVMSGVYSGLPVDSEQYLGEIVAQERAHGMPTGLLAWLLWVESGYRKGVIDGSIVGRSGELGIAQITPRWHPGVQYTDAVSSIRYAAGYLERLFDRFGSWEEAVAAYNWGEGNLADKGLSAMPDVTRRYLDKLRSHGVVL